MIQKAMKIFISLFTMLLLSMIIFQPENIFQPFEFFEWSFEVGIYLVVFIIAIFGSFMSDENKSDVLFLFSLLFALIINTNYLVTNTGYSFVYYSFAYFFIVAGFLLIELNSINIFKLLTDTNNQSLLRILGLVSILFTGLLFNIYISYSYFIYIFYVTIIVLLFSLELIKKTEKFKNMLFLLSILFVLFNIWILINDIYAMEYIDFWIYGIVILSIFIAANWIYYIFFIKNMFVSFQQKFSNFFNLKRLIRKLKK